MARIPMGNFGNALPEVQQTQTVQSNLGELGQAIGELGRVAGALNQERKQKEEEQDVRDKIIELKKGEQDQAQAQMQIDDVLTSDFSSFISTLKNDVGNGKYTAQQADAALTAWSDERLKSVMENVPYSVQDQAKNYWSANVNKQRGSFVPLQLKADEQQGYALADQFMGIYTRPDVDRTEGEQKLKFNLQRLNLPEAYITEQMQKYNITRDVTEVNSSITSAVESNDIQALQTLRSDIKNKKYLNGEQIQNFDNSIASKIGALQQRQQTLENKRVNEAGKVLNEYVDNVMTGRAIDASYSSHVAQAVKGTEYEQQYDFYSKHSDNFQKFSKLSTSDQLKQINQTKANMANSASADAQTEQKLLGAYERIYNEKLDTIKNNPVQAIREQNIDVPELKGMTLKTAPTQFIKDLVNIGTTLLSMQKKDPNITIRPISPEALPEVKQAFDGLSVNQKLNFIGDLIGQTKSVPGGAKVWGATLGQLGDGDLSYVMAGLARMNGYKSNQGEDTATAILRGTEILKNKQFIMPKEDDLKTAFNAYMGQSVGGADANMMYSSFRAVYADMVNRSGQLHKAKDDAPNASLAQSALSVATGGTYTQNGSFTNYFGGTVKDWKVSKPYGMSDDLFESHLDGGYRALSKVTGYSSDDLKGFRLFRHGTGGKGEISYVLLNEQGKPLKYASGRDALIIISGATR